MNSQSHARRWARHVAAAATFVMGFAACDATSSPVTPPSAGSQFTADITGTVQGQLNGVAESLGDGGSVPAWALTLTGAGNSGGISFTVEGMARPGPGTYTIASALEHGGNAPNQEFTAILALASPPSAFGSLTGTLTITDSSPTSVSGRFTFTAQDAGDAARNVTANGTFTANNRDL